MANVPLMPKATAVWLVDNTALTFEQIAQFCELHELEVKGIADGDVAQGIRGMDPVTSGQLTRDEIERAQSDPAYRLTIAEAKVDIPQVTTKKGPKYTPLSRRQDRPTAIAWLLRYHPELRDAEIGRLVGTTKPTIQAIRDRTHWNSAALQPQDPVVLGLSTQTELDAVVKKAAERVERERAKAVKAGTVLPTEQTIASPAVPQVEPEPEIEEVEKPADAASVFGKSEPVEPQGVDAEEPAPDADSVFAKLKELKPEKSDT
ncbi:MAG: DUF1013 domain-containing protein [Alphaproteobacteria bacterium]